MCESGQDKFSFTSVLVSTTSQEKAANDEYFTFCVIIIFQIKSYLQILSRCFNRVTNKMIKPERFHHYTTEMTFSRGNWRDPFDTQTRNSEEIH